MNNFKFSKYSHTLLLFVQDSAYSSSRTFRLVTYPEASLVTQKYFAGLTLRENERLKLLQSFASCTCNSHCNTIEMIPAWEVNSLSAAKGTSICFLFWNDMDGNSSHNKPPLVRILKQLNPVPRHPIFSFSINFNVILASTSGFLWPLPWVIHAHSSNKALLYNPNNIWWRIQITMHFTVQFY